MSLINIRNFVLTATLAATLRAEVSPPAPTGVPMSQPNAVIAKHEFRYGANVSWADLGDGRILMCGGSMFHLSRDKGVTWSPASPGVDEKGSRVSDVVSLVAIKPGVVGMLQAIPVKDPKILDEHSLLFRTSRDAGKTWSEAVALNSREPRALIRYDRMIRTSSGRLIVPVYTYTGPGGARMPGSPIPGSFVNGTGPFVPTDTGFFDPNFYASYLYISDDEGQTWRQNRDGKLLIHVEAGGRIDWTADPSVAEIAPGKLLMILRSRLGRLYESRSMNNGDSWTQPAPTQLASTQSPAALVALKGKAHGHLLVVFNQHSEQETRKGFVRTRLSSAISRTEGRLWEYFQNIESIHPETHVPPGPVRFVRPESAYPAEGGPAPSADPQYAVPLPAGYGQWAHPSVLVMDDRILVSYSHVWYDANGEKQGEGANRLKVLPLKWLYGNRDALPLQK